MPEKSCRAESAEVAERERRQRRSVLRRVRRDAEPPRTPQKGGASSIPFTNRSTPSFGRHRGEDSLSFPPPLLRRSTRLCLGLCALGVLCARPLLLSEQNCRAEFAEGAEGATLISAVSAASARNVFCRSGDLAQSSQRTQRGRGGREDLFCGGFGETPNRRERLRRAAPRPFRSPTAQCHPSKEQR